MCVYVYMYIYIVVSYIDVYKSIRICIYMYIYRGRYILDVNIYLLMINVYILTYIINDICVYI
jgi:hypothetical protein